ncbi:MAG TPA: hypothetical protein EYP36_00040 [Calditrichaeota bacterium]|nr:hypothetical protein [Calditrichota bacterium]
MRKTFVFLLILWFSSLPLTGQVVYEPINHSVYNFLAITAQKGLFVYKDEIKPLTRMQIAAYLDSIRSQSLTRLTPLQKRELDFYLSDFYHELSLIKTDVDTSAGITFFRRDTAKRRRFFMYNDSLFHVYLSPVIERTIGFKDGASFEGHRDGLSFYGTIGNHIGFRFRFTNEGESGANIDTSREFSPEKGMILLKSKVKKDKLVFDRIEMALSVNWDWGSFTIGKGNILWGYGASGRLVLSNKAPSWPFIRLDVQPVDWLSFNYNHGWLSSDVIDSSQSYPTDLKESQRIIYRPKYMANHSIVIYPLNGLSISLGESIVYADQLKFVYLQPLMFFRPADHYLSGPAANDAGDNAQIFMAISSRNHIPRTHFYGALFIDELNLNKIFSKNHRNQIAYQLGASVVDFPLNNLDISIEYVRLNPFVYRHYIATQTYQNAGYTMGHWIEHNADMLSASFNYRIIRGLKAKMWWRFIRKGEDGNAKQQYSVPLPPFLFGLNTNYSQYGLDVRYEIFHDLHLRLQAEFFGAEKEQENGGFITTNRQNYYFSVYYGF